MNIIQQSFIKLTLFLTLIACNQSAFENYNKGQITLSQNEKLVVYIADTPDRQQLGLSGIKPGQFNSHETMLFPSNSQKPRQFWMPETFFDLDIIFLTKDLYVLDIHRNVPHHKERYPRENVPLSKRVDCHHVLEIKSSSPLSKKIKIGMKLNWTGQVSLEKILQEIHPEL